MVWKQRVDDGDIDDGYDGWWYGIYIPKVLWFSWAIPGGHWFNRIGSHLPIKSYREQVWPKIYKEVVEYCKCLV